MGAGRQAGALAVTCLFPILAAVFVGARTFSRYLGQNFGWDDWLIHLSLLLLLGQTLTIYECMLCDRRKQVWLLTLIRHPREPHRLPQQ
jgi:hypothetical protein